MPQMGAITVTTSPTPVLATNYKRRVMFIKSVKTNASTIYLKLDDSETVLTTSNGFPLEAGESIIIVNNKYTTPIGQSAPNTEYWCGVSAIVPAGTAEIRYSEME